MVDIEHILYIVPFGESSLYDFHFLLRTKHTSYAALFEAQMSNGLKGTTISGKTFLWVGVNDLKEPQISSTFACHCEVMDYQLKPQ